MSRSAFTPEGKRLEAEENGDDRRRAHVGDGSSGGDRVGNNKFRAAHIFVVDATAISIERSIGTAASATTAIAVTASVTAAASAPCPGHARSACRRVSEPARQISRVDAEEGQLGELLSVLSDDRGAGAGDAQGGAEADGREAGDAL